MLFCSFQAVFSFAENADDSDPESEIDVTYDVIRDKRQLPFDFIMADILKAQEQVIESHCSSNVTVCLQQGPKGEKGAAGTDGKCSMIEDKGVIAASEDNAAYQYA